MQRARDGRGGEGEDVDVDLELLDALFVGDAEALLFVDHQEPQAFEVHVFREQPMGADDDVDRAVFETADDLGLLLLRLKTRECPDFERIVAHAPLERERVLLREHRGGAQHGDLLARFGHAKRGANGHFGLAEANVAAYQAVHGARRLEVLENVGNRARLVGGFVECKRCLEGAVLVVDGGKRLSDHGLSFGVETK